MQKAQIFSNYNYNPENYYNNLQIALRHYKAIDTLINQVRIEMKTNSDKLALGEEANHAYTEAIAVCYQLAELSDNKKDTEKYLQMAFGFSEKNKSSVLLESLAGAEAMKFSGIPNELLDKESNLQSNINVAKQIIAERSDSLKVAAFQSKLFNYNRAYDSLIHVFETNYREYFELKYSNKLASIDDLQGILDKKTTIISYTETDSLIYAFVISKNQYFVKQLPKTTDYEKLLDIIRMQIMSRVGNTKYFAENMNKLHKQLFDFEIPANTENLLIIPSGKMALLPFEALVTDLGDVEKNDYSQLSYLINEYNISYSYSANLFYRTFPKDKTQKIEVTQLNDWLAYAPVFSDESTGYLTKQTHEMLRAMDENTVDTLQTRGTLLSGEYISPLPGTRSEVEDILEVFDSQHKKANALFNLSANEASVKSGDLENYKYIHFASHGMVNMEKPELSGIILAQDSTIDEDGILYIGEMFNLKLNADLTVLSACETGIGEIKKGEGLIGLSRALLYAGSKNIIVSLWKVADNSTKDLMLDFYNNLIENETESSGFSKPLREAKLQMIQNKTYAHPYYWSPFILIGK